MSIADKIRSAERRKKDMAYKAELAKRAEADRAAGVIVIKTPRPLSDVVRAQIEKQVLDELGISREVTQFNVRLACKQMLGMLPHDRSRLRKGVMVNLPGEIRKVLQGRTTSEAFSFYWELPEFREVWPKLGFVEEDLRKFINIMAKQAGKEQI